MAKLRSYKMVWGAVPEPNDIVTYRIRSRLNAFNVADLNDPANYDPPWDDVGEVSTCKLPLPNTPLVDADLHIALSSVDDQGNESDQVFTSFPFDLIAPPPPTGLSVE